jgi:Spy/CpxP family protein refolding chaperone
LFLRVFRDEVFRAQSAARVEQSWCCDVEDLNDKLTGTVYVASMTKLIALVAAGLFAAGTMFAGQHGDCTKQIGNKENMAACHASLTDLNLTAEQKTKMDAVMAEHMKEGCSEATEAKYMKEAKRILNKEQYAKFKAECKKGDKDKTQT